MKLNIKKNKKNHYHKKKINDKKVTDFLTHKQHNKATGGLGIGGSFMRAYGLQFSST